MHILRLTVTPLGQKFDMPEGIQEIVYLKNAGPNSVSIAVGESLGNDFVTLGSGVSITHIPIRDSELSLFMQTGLLLNTTIEIIYVVA